MANTKYSGIFGGGGNPIASRGTTTVMNPDTLNLDPRKNYLTFSQDNITNDKTAAFDGLDEILAGNDNIANKYSSQLKSIIGNYGTAFSTYKGNITPIIAAMSKDIDAANAQVDDYAAYVKSKQDSFERGILVEPNATARQERYRGAVADQYAGAQDSFRRQQASQGINPYRDSSANRDFRIKAAAASADATNRGYEDFRAQHNADVQKKQAALAKYADLLGVGANLRTGLAGARGSLLDAQTGLFQGELESNRLKAQGINNLYKQNQDRRTEALELAKYSDQMGLKRAAMKNQLFLNTNQSPVFEGFSGSRPAPGSGPNGIIQRSAGRAKVY